VPLLPAGLSPSGKTAGIKFTHRPKISIFAPQGRLAAPIHVKFGTAEGHACPLAVQNFTPIGARGWERGPQSGKNFHFLVKSPFARANPLTDLYFC